MNENKWLYSAKFKGMSGVILESRGGAKSSINERNPDYKLLLQYILEFFKNKTNCTIQIYIASKRETRYPNLTDRLLSIEGKDSFDLTNIDIDEFIPKLSKRIRESGQTGKEKGGNSTKRLFFHQITGPIDLYPRYNISKSDSSLLISKEKLENILEKFSSRGNNNVKEIQNHLKEHLSMSLSSFNWEEEYMPNPEKRKDRFDIYGENEKTNQRIIIELDPHRADSISKKFVSRLAMMINHPILYVAFIYPGTKNMSRNETDKYIGDCEIICNMLNKSTNIQKEFIGYYL